MRTRLQKYRFRAEGGGSAVEFALVTPLVLMLMFGVLTGGLAWNTRQQLSTAAREGARFGATLPTDGDPDAVGGWLDKVVTRITDSAFGELGTSIPGRYVCVAFVTDSAAAAQNVRREVGTFPGDTPFPNNTCSPSPDGRPAGEQRVQVFVQRSSSFNIVVWQRDLPLAAQAVARFEAVP